jgi:hypothetical protein
MAVILWANKEWLMKLIAYAIGIGFFIVSGLMVFAESSHWAVIAVLVICGAMTIKIGAK